MDQIDGVKMYEFSMLNALENGFIKSKKDLEDENIIKKFPVCHNLTFTTQNGAIFQVPLKPLLGIKRMTKKTLEQIRDKFNMNREKLIGLEVECIKDKEISEEFMNTINELLKIK